MDKSCRFKRIVMKTISEPVADKEAALGVAHRYAPCRTLLRGAYPNLTEAERRVADVVLAHPDRVLLSSITELARESGVGASTVTRLGAKLGYVGYPALRTALAVELLNRDDQAPEPLDEADDGATVIRKVMRLGVQNLNDTAGLLDPEELERAAAAVVGARRVELYATGAMTGAMAQIAVHRLLLLGIPCASFTHHLLQGMSAGLLGERDVAIGFSFAGESKPTIDAIRAANAVGATTIGVTNAPRSSITREASIRLLSASSGVDLTSDHPAASVVAMTGVVDVLYAYTLLLRYRRQEGGPAAGVAVPNDDRQRTGA